MWAYFRDVSGLVRNRITSSANRLMVSMLEPNWKPGIKGCVLIASARGSIIRLKMVGERGHPCLVPFEMLKGVDRKPAEYTCADGHEYRARIAFSMEYLKPNLDKAISI